MHPRPRAALSIAFFASLALVLISCAQHRSVAPGQTMTVEEAFLAPAPDRTFRIRYLAQAGEIPAGTKKLRLWWPVPSNSNLQTISDLKFSGPVQPKLGREPKYGNQIAYVELDSPPSAVEFEMAFTCKRKEVRVDLGNLKEEGSDPAGSYAVFRAPDRLVIIDDQVKRLADEATRGRTGTVARARGIYDAVMGRMSYDKSGTGWGRGDTRFACEVGKGNCTDFHALFNSLCRASGIASGFEIGLYLPYEAKPHDAGKAAAGDTWQPAPGGYHCWAAFRVPGKTWVPVDISEADRFPERSEFFFGGHTSNRVTLSVGRDIILEPRQGGEPLNYLLDPYAEADGKTHKAAKTWLFQDR